MAPGFEAISYEEAVDEGITDADLQAPYQWSTEVGTWRLLLPTAGGILTKAERERARAMVHWYDETGVLVRRLANHSGPMSPKLQAIYDASAQFMGKWAQPVEAFKELETGEGDDRLGGSFGATPMHLAVAVVVLLTVATAGYSAYAISKMLGSQSVRAYDTYSLLYLAYLEEMERLRVCVANESLDRKVREECHALLTKLSPPDNPPNPLNDVTEMVKEIAKAAVPLVAIGAGLYLLGPLVRELSKEGGRRLAGT
jgi:hypothetical protein